MKLLRDQIVIRPDEQEEENVTPSGIIVPTAKQNQFSLGEVVQVGEYGHRASNGGTIPSSLNPGDRVLYRKFQSEEFDVDGGETGLRLATEAAVIGVLEPVASMS